MPKTAKKAAAGTLEGKRVLLADNDPHATNLVRALLEEAGARLTAVVNGAECLLQAKGSLFDLILLNLQLPDGDGCSLLTQLRSEQPSKGVPIILLSGEGNSKEVMKAIQKGGSDFLRKPFTPEELMKRVTRAVSRLDLVAVRRLVSQLSDMDEGLTLLCQMVGGSQYWVYLTTHNQIDLRVAVPRELVERGLATLSEVQAEQILFFANSPEGWRCVWPHSKSVVSR